MTHSTGKVFKLTAAGSIRKALGDVVEAKRNITISALFHGLVSSNVSWATDMQRSDAADLRGVLLSMGVHLDPGNAGRQMLVNFLQSQTPKRQMEAVLQTGWAGGQFKAYALPDCVIGPQASRVTFQSEVKGADEYTQRGTLDGWQQGIAAAAVGNPMLVLALCVAFAGPVLALVGAESGGLHLIGDSSTGKTTALQAAASVWGGDGFRRSWRTTANGLEGAAALFNDSLLALDEISECDPRDVGEVVYMLGNGRGKQRASRMGAARAVHRWRSSILSTGERSIATSMLDAGQRVKAGQAVRLLDIPVQLSVELGRTKVPIKYILQLAQGSVVELDALAGEPMDVLVNGYLIAQGEVVVVNDKFGIRLTDVVTPSERLRRVSRGG